MKLAMACHKMKNLNTQNYKDSAERNQIHNKVVYMTVIGKGDNEDRDWKIELGANSYTVTDMASGNSSVLKMDNFEFEHNSLIKMDLEQGKETIQFIGQQHDLKFDFYYQGG